MTVVMKLDFKGAKQLERKFRRLPQAMKGPILLKAANAGARPIRDDARRRAPRRGGLLKREIVDRVLSKDADLASVGVGWKRGKASRTPAFYGLFVEKGTAGRVRKSGGRTGRVSAKPFLQPAFDTNKDSSAKLMEGVLKAEIERVARG